MEIEDLYINSDRLVAGISLKHKRYLLINWNHRMICIKGARGVGKTTMLKQYLKEHYLAKHEVIFW